MTNKHIAARAYRLIAPFAAAVIACLSQISCTSSTPPDSLNSSDYVKDDSMDKCFFFKAVQLDDQKSDAATVGGSVVIACTALSKPHKEELRQHFNLHTAKGQEAFEMSWAESQQKLGTAAVLIEREWRRAHHLPADWVPGDAVPSR
jgi:hypothetical protein